MSVFTRVASWLGFGREEAPLALEYAVPPEQQVDEPPAKDRPPLTNPQFSTHTEWTTSEIVAAVDAHELGDFASSGRLADWMGRDPRLATELGKREKGLTSLPLDVKTTTDTPTPQETDIAERLEAGFFESFGEDIITSIQRWIVLMGFALCQVRWVVRADPQGKLLWWPTLEVWHPQWVFYDDFLKAWRVQTKEGFSYIKPGDGQWALFMPSGDRGWLQGAVRSLALPCFITSLDWLDWADFNDAVGHPVKVAYVARGTKKEDKATFISNLQLLGRRTNVLLCQKNQDDSGYDFAYKEPGSLATSTFKDSIEVSDRAKTLVILGQVLTTEASGSGIGGGGPAAVHKMILSTILEGDANGFSTCLRYQVLTWWAFWNFGNSTLAPWVCWDLTPPEDKKLKADTLTASAAALAAVNKSLAGTGQVVDVVVFWSDFGLPLIPIPEGSQTESLADQANTTRTVGYVMESIGKGLAGSGFVLDAEEYCKKYGIPLKAVVVEPTPPPAPAPTQPPALPNKPGEPTPPEQPQPPEEPIPQEQPPAEGEPPLKEAA